MTVRPDREARGGTHPGDKEHAGIREVVRRLVQLGLDEKAASVYVHLIRDGPQKASDIAAGLSLHRPDIYRLLQKLAQQGFVTAGGGRPTVYEAVPPAAVLTEMGRAQEVARRRFLEEREPLVASIEALRGAPASTPRRARYRFLQGRSEALREVERLVRTAQEEVLILSTSPLQAADRATHLFQLARERAEEGIHVRAILASIPEGLAARQRPKTFEVHAYVTSTPMRFVVRDEDELLAWMATDPSPRLHASRDVVLWTDSAEAIAGHRMLHDFVWRASD